MKQRKLLKEQSQQSKQEAGPKDVFLSLTDNCLCVRPLHFHINLKDPYDHPMKLVTSSTLTECPRGYRSQVPGKATQLERHTASKSDNANQATNL